MRNKPLIFVLVFCASIFSNKIDAQYSIGIDVQLNHDTITYGQGFDILVTLTNTGSFAITTPIYLWYGSRSVNVLSIDPRWHRCEQIDQMRLSPENLLMHEKTMKEAYLKEQEERLKN